MPEQQKRYTNEELSLIEATFKDQTGLLILLRRFLLQDELTKDELTYLKTSMTPEVLKLVKKTINPTLDKGAVLNGTVDLFSGMDVGQMLQTHATHQIKARHLVHKYLTQQFDWLEGKKPKTTIIFDELLDGDDDEEVYVNMIARNFLLGFIDTQGLRQLEFLALSNETPEQTKERLKAQSTK